MQQDVPAGGHRGRVVTFYSFKGGVGRTMALANIAILLARDGMRVLVVDWDLEAPGLDYYFDSEALVCSRPAVPGGLLSILESDSRREPADWRERVSTVTIKSEGIKFDFLSSGFRTANFADRLHDFSWPRYFAKRRGADLLERLRDEWMQAYRLVLLDSRTGLADSSGICTIQMPDWLVLVFTANEQNIDGCQRVADAARIERRKIPYDRPHLTVLPVLSRVDNPEGTVGGKKWMDAVAERFAPFYAEWLPKSISPRKVLDWTRLPYLQAHAFGEELPVLDTNSLSDPHELGFYYNIIARLLTSGFRDLRKILTAVGVADAKLDLLPSESVLRTLLQTDPGYARRKMVEIADFAAEDIDSVLIALERLADYSETFQPSEAEEILQRSVNLARKHNKDRPEETARLFLRHADILTRVGREEEALAGYIDASTFVQLEIGTSSPQYVSTLIALANFRANAKQQDIRNFTQAETLYRKALKSAEMIFADMEPVLANHFVAFAEFLARVGRERETVTQKVEALERLERAVTIYWAADAEDNIAYAAPLDAALRQLYTLLIELGRYREALKLAREIVERLEKRPHRVLALCDALERQGWVFEYLGKYEEARTLYERSLRLKEENWGEGSVRCGVACAKLADAFYNVGDYVDAERFCLRAVDIHTRFFGPESPETANTYAILAEIFGVTNRRPKAEQLLLRVLNIRRKAFGREHHRVAVTYAHLGLLLHEAERYNEAESYHARALDIDKRLYGDKHPEVAFDQLNLLSAQSKGGRRVRENRIWQRNLSILTKTFGINHEVVARKRVQYGEYLYETRQAQPALREIREAIATLKGLFPETHQYVIDAEVIYTRVSRAISVARHRADRPT